MQTTIKLPKRFWTKFAVDSAERGVFEPDDDDHASVEQLRALLSDAEYYADPHGPDQLPPGLKASAQRAASSVRLLIEGAK